VLYLYLHRGRGKWWALAMPFYTLVVSFILTPLGVVWYAKMAVSARNWGLIRPNRHLEQRSADIELERVAS